VQQALIERGYPVFGGADGVFGSVTQSLVSQFQRANGLAITGAHTGMMSRPTLGHAKRRAAWPRPRHRTAHGGVSDKRVLSVMLIVVSGVGS
jgi:peptidoglycan hydrolase-like protein with peptidoglycan-binding domain